MRTGLVTALLAAALACSLGGTLAQAAARDRVFVASYGSDSNPCTFGSPCKTFQQAVNTVAAGGEVTAIDSAGFGPISITQSVTITSPNGVEAGIVGGGSAAISIAAGPTDNIILRGLTIEGTNTGVPNGIAMSSGGYLQIFNCTVRGFATNDISVDMTAGVTIEISNTVIADAGQGGSPGLFMQNGAGTFDVALDNVTFENNRFGINAFATGAPLNLQVSNSHFKGNNWAVNLSGDAANKSATGTFKNVAISAPSNGAEGILLTQWTYAYLSQVTMTPQSEVGLDFEVGIDEAAYTDGTNHLGVIGGTPTFQTWTAQ
jgi:hypothetical protein